MKSFVLTVMVILLGALPLYAQNSVRVGTAAPLFSSTDLEGSGVSLDDLKGSVVVLTFWSTKCEICRHEIPRLNQFVESYGREKVSFLALTMESEEKVLPYLRTNPFRFRILPNSFGVLLQYADRDRAGNIDMGFPSFFVVDKSGVVRLKASGYDKTGLIRDSIDRLVNGQPAAGGR